ncbi:HAMP domain-containing methyl-accepting chemotaxis protein [Rhodopseudomonas palustris]|uniref:methyl-accepting chemotaxis protein n=1 Tax=Rhodopseudomonas palustris TaxID=1076 RepID=UPI002ACD2F19|nr:HAMP domain-containing methyl-accepting chemotaxis protein [Rhodopseudomonas palustris]WQG98203.1 HAMP domain-containing methyl-accepting chemotaxis protein [Rhodopseudomonas palustris]
MSLRLRLSHKINSIAAVGIAGVLALGGLFMLGSASQEAARLEDERARALGDSNTLLQIAMLEQRRAEKNFMLRKDDAYVAAHQEGGKSARATVADMIRQTEAAGRSDLTRNLRSIEAGYADYERHFAQLAAAQIKLGLKETLGLEGGLRKSVHEIEAALGKFDEPALTTTMLMMRRHEKDFMLRRNPKYGDDIKKRAAEFSARLAASGLPAATKADVDQKLAAYQHDFFAWMDAALVLARDELALVKSFRAIEPVIRDVGATIQQSTEQAKAAAAAAREATTLRMQIAIAAIILAVSLLGLLIGRSVARPLKGLTVGLKELGAGNFDVVLPGLDRHDEIGDMAKAVESFKLKAQEKARAESEAKAEQDRIAAEQRKHDMHRLATQFEEAVGEIVETVSSASTELEASATTLTTTAQHAQQFTTLVATASEEASTNVQSVASASEEMASSVNEISRQVQESARIASEAVTQAQETNDRVSHLSEAAARIGDVVELINSIASQTNLLALNATIEAARAGDAGRGFAVVASEVKLLAEQTAKATEQISQQVGGIQTATGQSVASIRQIGTTIARMSEIAETIAAAVEEQGAATQEISRNVQHAAAGTQQVSANIVEVQRGASETGSASTQVLSAAHSLSHDSTRLKDEVGRFLRTVRAA